MFHNCDLSGIGMYRKEKEQVQGYPSCERHISVVNKLNKEEMS